MAPISLRTTWQIFKKKYPMFEKSKKFKSDVGPQLDKFDKAHLELAQLQAAAQKKRAEIAVIGNSVAAALKGYGAVVEELAKSDAKIKSDFEEIGFHDFVNVYVLGRAAAKGIKKGPPLSVKNGITGKGGAGGRT